MNLLILENSEKISENKFILKNRKFFHLEKILKVEPQKKILAARINHSIGKFEVQKISLEEIIGEYFEESKEEKSIFQDIIFYIAYQRPQTTKKIIQLASNLGIKEIHFFPCERSENSYRDSKIWEEKNLNEEIILGLEQGKKFISPKIFHINKFHELKNIFKSESPYILHPSEHSSNFSIQKNPNKLEFIFGSESGFTEKEISYLEKNKCKKISISEIVLRTESAFLYLISQIEFKMKFHQ